MTEDPIPRVRVVSESARSTERPSGRRRGDRVVGAGRATQEAVDQAVAVARSDRPVLLLGPQGSGKEHLARAIHGWSSHRSGPFVMVSCTAVTESLLAREILGCSQSLHPSLPEEYPGGLARAAGGTLFIDAIDQLPQGVREVLVRAISDGRFSREGDGWIQLLRARIMTTALVPPERAVFDDMPHHVIRLSALADRLEDILPLAAHFLRIHADDIGVRPVGFTPEAREALVSEEWVGNVRELSERVRQAVKLVGGGAISAEALLLSTDDKDVPSFKEAKRAFETRYVSGLLQRCGGNISRAARLAKKDRKDFYDVIRRTGVDPSNFR